MNGATEQQLGFRPEDVKGKNIKDLHQNQVVYDAIAQQLKQGKEWRGPITYRRKSGGSIQVACRVIGSSVNSRWAKIHTNSNMCTNKKFPRSIPRPPSCHTIQLFHYNVHLSFVISRSDLLTHLINQSFFKCKNFKSVTSMPDAAEIKISRKLKNLLAVIFFSCAEKNLHIT